MHPTEVRLKLLMVRSLAGDAAAHCRLLTELGELLGRYFARRIGRAHSERDDLVQEALIAIHTRRASYDPARPLTPWVYAIAHHKLVDYFRRCGGRKTAPLVDAENVAAHDWVESATAAADLERLLADLPPHQLTAIRMVKLDGASVAETAARVGQSEASVKVGMHRGLQRVMAKLRREAEHEN